MNHDLENEIIHRRQSGQSIRGIAANLNIRCRRVAGVLRRRQQARDEETVNPELPRPVKRRATKLDGYEELIQRLLARYEKITATRLLEELRRAGYTGGYTILRERLKELRTRPTKPLVVRFETAPGAQAQMDWSVYELDFTQEGRRRRFTERQDFDTTLREHIRAFEHLQGVAATCLYDNMKVVVTRWEDDQPVYNTRFLAFATH
jgi:transposase